MPETVPGMWGAADTSDAVTFLNREHRFVFGEHEIYWAGAKDLRAQWFKIPATYVDPHNDYSWFQAAHAKGEPPGNTYYLWHYDRPVPEGTKILLEGDFSHGRLICVPDGRILAAAEGWVAKDWESARTDSASANRPNLYGPSA